MPWHMYACGYEIGVKADAICRTQVCIYDNRGVGLSSVPLGRYTTSIMVSVARSFQAWLTISGSELLDCSYTGRRCGCAAGPFALEQFQERSHCRGLHGRVCALLFYPVECRYLFTVSGHECARRVAYALYLPLDLNRRAYYMYLYAHIDLLLDMLYASHNSCNVCRRMIAQEVALLVPERIVSLSLLCTYSGMLPSS